MKIPFSHKVKARFSSSAWGWFESMFFTALVLGLSVYFRPSDPFFFNAAFPWLWLVSVLVALRYGIGPGLLSVAIVAIAFILLLSQQSLDFIYFRLYMLGGIILTAVCGEYSSAWSHRLRRTQQLSAYMEQSFNSLTRAYYLIRLSHDRLEQNLISKPITLRSAMGTLRKILIDHEGHMTAEVAERFINLVAHACSLERAGLYLSAQGKMNTQPIAIAGAQKDLDLSDPLVQQSLTDKSLNYYTISKLEKPRLTRYLVVAPLVSSEGRLLGLLAVEDMPFLALQKDTLLVMTVMMNYLADELWASRNANDIVTYYPDCPSRFASELYKLARLKRDLAIDSSIVCFHLHESKYKRDIILELKKQQRGLDYLWLLNDHNHSLVLNLMAFSHAQGVASYLERINILLKENYNINDPSACYTVRSETIPLKMSVDFLKNIIVEDRPKQSCAGVLS